METKHILSQIQSRFRTFGGGKATEGNPMSYALKDKPLHFAAGVDVQEVVDFVLEKAVAPDLLYELKCFVQYVQTHPRGCRYSRLKEAEAVIALAEKGE